ncbi:MAG: alpha/beta hydrolase [Minwuia thermotolerans]|nr:MAG: alpha/beta hydrolase [Minwuia thermotolerans]
MPPNLSEDHSVPMPEVIFNGPEGRLEGRYHHVEDETAPIALVLHPHPLYGGNMNNRLVYNMFQLFKARGFSVLRFNFRGVGRSQGEHDQGIGELSDAASALDWMQQIKPDARACWIAGYSFGAWIGMQLLMRRPEVEGFISVSPPANMFDFTFLAPCPSSGIIVQGTEDDLVPEPDVQKLVDRLKTQKGIIIDYEKIDGANHFYEQEMEEVDQLVGSYVDRRRAAIEGL